MPKRSLRPPARPAKAVSATSEMGPKESREKIADTRPADSVPVPTRKLASDGRIMQGTQSECTGLESIG